jgi:hypothetical protein
MYKRKKKLTKMKCKRKNLKQHIVSKCNVFALIFHGLKFANYRMNEINYRKFYWIAF